MEDVENIELLDATIVNHVENDQSANFIPRVGIEFVSEEEAYNFYNEYGRRYGFSIRKERGNWNKKTRQLTSRLFVCSKEGIRSSDKRDHQTKNARAETRTDCGARMLIKFNKHSGKFQIKEIVVEHNHVLHVATCVHMMRSQRKMSEAQAMEVDLADQSGIKVQPSYELMRRQAGGHDGLGYTKEDLKNYLGSKRRRALKYGEAGTLLRHLGPKFSEESGLPRELSNCVYAFEEENELSKAWEDMIDRHELIDNNWVKEIYKVKEKWAKAYVKRTFSAGISSTQISESFNSSLKDHLQPDMNLVQFFGHFERVLNDKLYNELKSEFDLRQKLPKLKMNTPMLKQAGEIYTVAMLDKFQYEYEKFQAAFIEEKKETDDHLPEYVVAIYSQIGIGKVVYNDEEMTVSCSCKKFEMEGILCSHALKVLDLMNIKLIPYRYILKRWTKHARDGNVQDFDGHDVEVDPKLQVASRYRWLCSNMIKIASRASEYEEAYIFLGNCLKEACKNVEHIIQEKLGMKHGEICQQSLLELEGVDKENHLEIFAPIKAKGLKKKDSCKGRPRLKSWTEKLSTKKNKVDSQILLPTSFINPYEGISMPDYRAWTHDESQVISHPNFSEMLMEAMTPNSYGGFDVPSQFLDQNRLNEEQDDLLSQVGILGDVSNTSNMKSH
ncbi:hypothetical protein COLO4_29562 [Corchorus olitorius]|uniref:SWIM-type domain-containing protein n=1 Tax=Corchorus olitorius TaxID=93759 RepID=A0A1R3HE48_9ROSI|nr:hypothetical protein COLO4_29562 [Corchorus olitorius]